MKNPNQNSGYNDLQKKREYIEHTRTQNRTLDSTQIYRTRCESFFHIMSDKQVNTYLPLFPFETIEEANHYLHENYLKSHKKTMGFRYAMCLKSDNVPIGYVNIADNDSYDLGYRLGKEHWHKGIVTEACKAVVEQV